MIREANIYDILSINELGKLLNPQFSDLFKINEMLNDQVSKVIVYVEDQQIVGFLTATVLYETCDILSLVVAPDMRQKHIATNLLAYLITDLGENNKLITLEVATKNQAALKLYENFDFQIINTRKNYYPDDDAYLMARKVENNERY